MPVDSPEGRTQRRTASPAFVFRGYRPGWPPYRATRSPRQLPVGSFPGIRPSLPLATAVASSARDRMPSLR
jgi:hypothetical protein